MKPLPKLFRARAVRTPWQVAPQWMCTLYRPSLNLWSVVMWAYTVAFQVVGWALLLGAWVLVRAAIAWWNCLALPVLVIAFCRWQAHRAGVQGHTMTAVLQGLPAPPVAQALPAAQPMLALPAASVPAQLRPPILSDDGEFVSTEHGLVFVQQVGDHSKLVTGVLQGSPSREWP